MTKINKVLDSIKELLSKGERKEAIVIYKKNIVAIEKHLQNCEYKRTTGQNYSGYNQLFISLQYEPGIFGTFKQLKALGYSTKGLKGVQLLMPMFLHNKTDKKQVQKQGEKQGKKTDKKDSEILSGFKKYYVFPMINKLDKS